jgi:hypothetical protein
MRARTIMTIRKTNIIYFFESEGIKLKAKADACKLYT